MSTAFDPYVQWLGIERDGFHPDRYQLLGLPPFESDAAKITEAAVHRTDRLAVHLAGDHADLAQRLLGEIDAAKLAQERASTREVQAFAGRVLNEHRELAQANGRLATELSLQGEPSALASQLTHNHEEAMRKLRALSGPAFDRAYVENEIQQHVWAFNFLETAAEEEGNISLKQELVRTGPDLLSHISAARALERHLGSDHQETVAVR